MASYTLLSRDQWPQGLAYSWYQHYGKVSDVQYDVKTRALSFVELRNSKNATEANDPLLGTTVASEYWNRILTTPTSKSASRKMIQWFGTREARFKLMQNDHFLVLYSLTASFYDWKVRSLNPFWRYSYKFRCYELRIPNRPVYVTHGANYDRLCSTLFGDSLLVARVPLELMEDLTDCGMVQRSDVEYKLCLGWYEALEQVLSDLEPQYHTDEAGYF